MTTATDLAQARLDLVTAYQPEDLTVLDSADLSAALAEWRRALGRLRSVMLGYCSGWGTLAPVPLPAGTPRPGWPRPPVATPLWNLLDDLLSADPASFPSAVRLGDSEPAFLADLAAEWREWLALPVRIMACHASRTPDALIRDVRGWSADRPRFAVVPAVREVA